MKRGGGERGEEQTLLGTMAKEAGDFSDAGDFEGW